MILASFKYNYVVAAGGNTADVFSLGFAFRSLFQFDHDDQIVLSYAGISLIKSDLAGSPTGETNAMARLLGNFNETRNVVPSILTPVRAGDTVVAFSGITFNMFAPFYAPIGSRILMPDTFQCEVTPSHNLQNSVGDSLDCLLTFGYDVEKAAGAVFNKK